MVNAAELAAALDLSFEWLGVFADGRSVPLRRDEIEVTNGRSGNAVIGLVDDVGFRSFGVLKCELADGEIMLELAGEFGRAAGTLRLVPRESAAELAANIEIARLRRAGEIAEIVCAELGELTVQKVSLTPSGGRIARIIAKGRDGKKTAFITDVTATVSHETLLTTALDELEKLRSRKKDPIDAIQVIVERPRSRKLQRLIALTVPAVRASVGVVEFSETKDERAVTLRQLMLNELWRPKPARLSNPETITPGETAAAILTPTPDKLDIVFSRHGENVRFHGLSFVRVRRAMELERAWFGVRAQRQPLGSLSDNDYCRLLDDLHRYRDAETPSREHAYYRLAPEAWLESILRRNIKLLDPNLVLSPIYNQFRTSSEKIDLLAVRRDGRLVIIEIKTEPDRDTVFQAADYWQKIEHQRRRGVLAEARLFGERTIADVPALVYVVAPAFAFHSDFERHARCLSGEIEMWRWELHPEWRKKIKVLRRLRYEKALTPAA